MLTKEDLEQIETIVQVNITVAITAAFQDFYDNVFEPHVNQSTREHKEILQEIKKLQYKANEQDELLEGHTERLKILEKRTDY
jgi:hypothetical protein